MTSRSQLPDNIASSENMDIYWLDREEGIISLAMHGRGITLQLDQEDFQELSRLVSEAQTVIGVDPVAVKDQPERTSGVAAYSF